MFKVYSTVSGRRFMCDLEEWHRRGYITRLPHFNSLYNAFDRESLRPILCDLIRRAPYR